MSISYGIIGSGRMAREHLRAFSDIENSRFVGIASTNPKTARFLCDSVGSGRVFESGVDLYQATTPDVIIVAVPPHVSFRVLTELCGLPCLLLSEKPVGLDADQARTLEFRSRDSGSRLFVALNRRFYGSTKALLDHLQSDAHRRERRSILVLDQQHVLGRDGDKFPESVRQRFMYANSIHLIDYFLLLGRGEVSSVHVAVPYTPGRNCSVVASIEFKDGDVGVYRAIWEGEAPWAVSVSTPSSYCECRPLESVSTLLDTSRRPAVEPASEWDLQFKPGLREQARHVELAVHGEEHRLVSLSGYCRSADLVKRIYGV
jgi:predicted dehydrogenase